MGFPTGTVTLLFTDIEGSTGLLHRLGDGYAAMLQEHHRIVREALAIHGGHEVDTQGDAFFAVFDRARDGVAAAADVQRALAAHSWADGVVVRVRMGLHTGAPALTRTGYVGIAVHLAARIGAAAHGAQVLASEVTCAALREAPVDGVAVRDVGEHLLKDIPEPVRLGRLEIAGVWQSSAAPRSRPRAVWHLPPPRAPVLGRDALRDAIAAELGDASVRLLTLTGPAGVGKTTLALDVAVRVAGEFPAGAGFCDLAAVSDAARLDAAIVERLGIGGGGNARRAIVAALGTPGRSLLVLDNLEQIEGVAAPVAELLDACPGVTAVATSRVPLRLAAEQEWRVPPLDGSPAAQVFVRRARAADRAFSPTAETTQAIAALCERLDGLPLAIELAAARTRTLPPQAMLARLERRLDLLVRGAPDLPERQRSLEAAIAWSHDLLGAPEQRLFAQLAVFPAQFTLEAAEAVCDGDEVLDGLEALVEQSLVLREVADDAEPGFRMLETVREFAGERLRERPEAAVVRHRLACRCAAFADLAARRIGAGADAAWRRRLALELPAARAVMADDALDPGLRLRIAGGLWWFLKLQGAWSEAREWVERALAATPDSRSRPEGPPPPAHATARAIALAGACTLAINHGDVPGGLRHVPALQALLAEPPEPWIVSHVHLALGLAAAVTDDVEAERAHHEQAAASAAGIEPRARAKALVNLGDLAMRQRDHERALACFGESLDLERRSDMITAVTLGNIGTVRLLLGEHEPAYDAFAAALAEAEAHGDPDGHWYATEGLGWISARRGDDVPAALLLGAGEAQRRRLRMRRVGAEGQLQAEALEALRARLGAERLEALLQEGMALPAGAVRSLIPGGVHLGPSGAGSAGAAVEGPVRLGVPAR